MHTSAATDSVHRIGWGATVRQGRMQLLLLLLLVMLLVMHLLLLQFLLLLLLDLLLDFERLTEVRRQRRQWQRASDLLRLRRLHRRRDGRQRHTDSGGSWRRDNSRGERHRRNRSGNERSSGFGR